MRSTNGISAGVSPTISQHQVESPLKLIDFLDPQSGRLDVDKLLSHVNQRGSEDPQAQGELMEALDEALQQADIHPFDLAKLRSALAENADKNAANSALLASLGQLTAHTDIPTLQNIFGTDIPVAAYQAMQQDLRLGTFSMPAIKSGMALPPDVKAAYDSASKTIFVAKDHTDNGATDNCKRLVSEEFGHHIDNLLRNHYSQVGKDAPLDEGALFAREVAGCSVSDADIAFDGKLGNLEFHNEAGHYYGTLLALNSLGSTLGLSQIDKEKIAGWAQLPDELSALDAIAVETQNLKTMGMGKAVDGENHSLLTDSSADIKALRDTIHTMHSLIGKSMRPEEYRTQIKQMMHDVWNAPDKQYDHNEKLALLGILTHSFGDSYAHIKVGTERELATAANGSNQTWKGFDRSGHEITLHPWTGTFYGAGQGHLFDGRAPDDIKADLISHLPKDSDKLNDNRIRMFESMEHDLIDTFAQVLLPPGSSAASDITKNAHNTLNQTLQNQIIPDLEFQRLRNTHTVVTTPNGKTKHYSVQQDTDEMRSSTMVIMNQAVHPELLPQGDNAVALRRLDQSGEHNRTEFYKRTQQNYHPEEFDPLDGISLKSWTRGAATRIGGLNKNIDTMHSKENKLVGTVTPALEGKSANDILDILHLYQNMIKPTLDKIKSSGKNE